MRTIENIAPVLTAMRARLASVAAPLPKRASALFQRAADACESIPDNSVPTVTLRMFNGLLVTIPASAEVRVNKKGRVFDWQTWGPGITPILSAGDVAADIAAGRPIRPSSSSR